MTARAVNRRARGQLGELVACARYLASGHRILGRRVRHRDAEIDLLCRRGRTLVLVEVKYRGERSVSVEDALSRAQLDRLRRASGDLARQPWVRAVRIDLVIVSSGSVRILRDCGRRPWGSSSIGR